MSISPIVTACCCRALSARIRSSVTIAPAANYAVGVYMAGAGYSLFESTMILAKPLRIRTFQQLRCSEPAGVDHGWVAGRGRRTLAINAPTDFPIALPEHLADPNLIGNGAGGIRRRCVLRRRHGEKRQRG